MQTKIRSCLIGLLGLLGSVTWAVAQGTAFTYQGKLTDGGQAAHGLFDFRFAIFDSAGGGSAVAGPLTNSAVAVSNGLFTVTLDFGGGVFTGEARWLEIAVRTNGAGGFVPLSPRHALTPSPYAITASNLTGMLPASQLSGAIPSANLAGTYSSAVTFNNAANSFTGNGAGLTALDASQLTSGTVPDERLAGNVARTNQVWLLGGNAGTTPDTHFVGTTDWQPLELRVYNLRAFRLEPGLDGLSPNLIGGYGGNFIDSWTCGSTIGGGGFVDFTNAIFGSFSTIAGGAANRIYAPNSTIGGGYQNTIGSAAYLSTIGGGFYNTIQPWAFYATIGGGHNNTIQSEADCSTIGGGEYNTIGVDALYATIPGGLSNAASRYAFAAGRRAKANHTGAFVWADSTDADFASTGTNQFLIRASGGVGIGTNNPQSLLHVAGTVTASAFTGTGAGLTGLNADNLSAGTLPAGRLSGTYGNALVLNNPANSFAGNGAGLTALDASQLTTGTVADARLSANVSLLGQSIESAEITDGTIADADISPSAAIADTKLSTISTPGKVANSATTATSANVANAIVARDASGNFSAGTVTATAFSGSGAALTALNAFALTSGTVPDARLSANVSLLGQSIESAEITDGTIANADISPSAAIADTKLATISTPGKVANSATTATSANVPNAIVARDGSGNFTAGTVTATAFSGSGASLTALNASALTSGTVPDARLSANVPLKNQANMFTALNTFQPATGAPFAVGSTNKVTNLNADLLDGVDVTGFWKTSGNADTKPDMNFVGTTDNQPLDLRVNAQRAVRLEPTGSNSVNVIAGYGGNWVKPGVVAATISGGGAGNYAGAAYTNRIEADAATIGGGGGNAILSGSLYATIGGGVLSTISSNAQFASITGGSVNTISPGATGATIGGGVNNLIGTNAQYAMIPGGANCTASGTNSFAAGRRAKAIHPGSFVWADNQDADCVSLANNHVRFRCQSGVRFSSGSEGANQHVFWNPGDATWTFTSDRNLKENFKPVDTRAVLEQLAAVPITEWNYIGYAQRHIGPVAQDFHAAFPFSGSDTTLNSGDLHGVALAAIQGVNKKLTDELKRRDAENAELRRELAELKRLVQQHIK